MTLWTIQPEDVWNQVQNDGVAVVDIARLGSTGYVPPAYEWLLDQLMRRRNWNPDRLPWWCYCGKPDLRCYRFCGWERSAEVRIELEVPPQRVLVMPCWA